MVTFEQFWQLLYDHGSSNYYQNEVYSRWSSLTPDHQQQLFDRIRQKIADGRFVSYNPLEAVHDNLPRCAKVRKQTLSYNEYYSTFRTTNPINGWRMEKDANGKVFYSKIHDKVEPLSSRSRSIVEPFPRLYRTFAH